MPLCPQHRQVRSQRAVYRLRETVVQSQHRRGESLHRLYNQVHRRVLAIPEWEQQDLLRHLKSREVDQW